ncbi:MAG: alpha/beta hydrolase [Actinobacteria bacterium]|nr:alpha/beta hydrolase [Actinomycetota bacterium]
MTPIRVAIASPVRPTCSRDRARFCSAVVMTAEFDPLRDEGEQYARRLADAGVPVTAKCWDGHVHGSLTMTALVPSSREWSDAVIAALQNAYRS